MTGSGNGNTGPDNQSPCDDLRFDAQLASPQPAVVSTLSAGEVLEVSVVTMKGQVVVQVQKNGQPAGGLAGPDATRLRKCIEAGHEYKATVRALNGGQVRVRIEHA